MTGFANNVFFEVELCCNCGIAFAMTADFQRRRRDDRKTFYCPSGHPQHYTGQTEEQKLRAELERKQQMLDAAEAKAATALAERNQITKAHRRMRARVMNGVCPCCNRTFQNLMAHMRTEHPDFTAEQSLRALRTAFGMSQAAVAKEAGVKQSHVSLYERNRPIAGYAKDRIGWWLESHKAGA